MKPERPLLNYFGGKWNAGEWIISHFPEHEIYCEPFAGGAAVLLQKPRSKREIINDVDDELINLFHVMREKWPSLERKLKLTPHSRTEYVRAYVAAKNPVERARRTIVKSYFGIGDSQFHKGNGMRTSKTSNTCVAKSWMNWVDFAWQIAERLRGVTIENLDYKKVMAKYSSPQTLFYLDPPYMKNLRNDRHGYRHDFSDKCHKTLLKFISGLDSKIILSGYDNALYDSLKWNKVHKDFRTQKHSKKTETLWMNVEPEKQMSWGGL